MAYIKLNANIVRNAVNKVKLSNDELQSTLSRLENLRDEIARNWAGPRSHELQTSLDRWITMEELQIRNLEKIVQEIEVFIKDIDVAMQ